MFILGIAFGHSAAAVLLKDGKVISAVEEEKLSRIKGHNTFPKLSISYLLNKHHLEPKDIDIIAIGCEDLAEFSYGHRTINRYFGKDGLPDKISGLFLDGIKNLFPGLDIRDEIRKVFYRHLAALGFSKEKVTLINHHHAHAASAYYSSGWEAAAIVTSDGKGDGLCGAFFTGSRGKITCHDKVADLNSIGQFYQIVTKFLGYKVNRHEGKITGLAAFGDPSKSFRLMNEIYRFDNGTLKNMFHEDGFFRKDPVKYFVKSVEPKSFIPINYLKSLHGTLINFAVAYQLYLNFLKSKMGNFEPKDIAAGIQKLTEEALVAYVKKELAKHPNSKLCLAGGVFANVKVNQRIREIPGVENVYVQPAMDDSGTALGAAVCAWMRSSDNKDKEYAKLESVYLGPSYTDEEIEKALRKYNIAYKKVDNAEEMLGKLIFDGKIIGRFNNALEWGPRALGNRSILARPIHKNINDTLNKRLNRTEFMPFAPSILSDDAPDFLESYSPGHLAAKYMTITYNVKPSKINNIQAAVHIDGTARPQVVFQEDNPSYYKIIEAYKKYSGFGVIINTSFNMHEEPIVNSPEDAIRSFLAGAVDVLSMGPFIAEPVKK